MPSEFPTIRIRFAMTPSLDHFQYNNELRDYEQLRAADDPFPAAGGSDRVRGDDGRVPGAGEARGDEPDSAIVGRAGGLRR